MTKIKGFERGFPGSRVVEKSTCQCRGGWFDPWLGKIPHASGRLSRSAVTVKPSRLKPELHERSRRNEQPVHLG